jgi:hypothetical protein
MIISCMYGSNNDRDENAECIHAHQNETKKQLYTKE